MTSQSRVIVVVCVIVVLASLAGEGVAMVTGIEEGLARFTAGFVAGGVSYHVIARGES